MGNNYCIDHLIINVIGQKESNVVIVQSVTKMMKIALNITSLHPHQRSVMEFLVIMEMDSILKEIAHNVSADVLVVLILKHVVTLDLFLIRVQINVIGLGM